MGTLVPMVMYGPVATLCNRGADQLKFPVDQLKLHGCVHFTKETCVCGFKMSKKWSFGPIQNYARPIVTAERPHMLETSGSHTYMSEDSSLRLCLLGVFHEKLILHFLYFLPVLLRCFFSDVIVDDNKKSWLGL